ncbi:glycosyltransferase [Patescibacteria group bacterium]|nr:glycosyltransferase [Patescibacteria group bacterium]
MKICLFGTYNQNYSRNSSIRDGLKMRGVKVTEAHVEVPKQRLELPEDFSLQESVARIWRKVRTSASLLGKYREALSCDCIAVLHPGHLDLPIAWLFARLGRKTLVFDASVSPYDTMIIGRDMAKKGSVKAKALKLAEGLLLRVPDRLFADTEMMKQFIVDEFAIKEKKIFVVPLGANDAVYFPKPKITSDGGNPNKIQVLFFGMYNPLQGAQHIVRAAKLLRNEKNIMLTLIGDGPIKKDLVGFVKKHKLTNVKFQGFMPEEKLVKRIQNADILLGIFSNSKIMQRVIPNKVFGSIACKKPLITARQPIMEEFFQHQKNVYFCKPQDPKTLAQAIKRLSADRNLREKIAKNSYQVYKDTFTPKQIGKAMLNGIGEKRS